MATIEGSAVATAEQAQAAEQLEKRLRENQQAVGTTPHDLQKAEQEEDYPQYPLDAKLAVRLDRDFTFHAVKPGQSPRYVRLRAGAKQLAYQIASYTPPGREQALALTKLEEAIFWANAAIARGET